MLRGKINGIEFTLEAGKAESADPLVKKIIETLEDEVYNPITNRTYDAKGNNDLDAFLILSKISIETGLQVTVDPPQDFEVATEEPGKVY